MGIESAPTPERPVTLDECQSAIIAYVNAGRPLSVAVFNFFGENPRNVLVRAKGSFELGNVESTARFRQLMTLTERIEQKRDEIPIKHRRI